MNALGKDLLVKMTTLEGKKIKCVLWERKRIVQGVITGVSTELTNEEIMKNVTRARVERVKRLTYNKDGVKESLSILLSMREKRLPTRIRVGYMSYQVREYIPPPLRCFKCQKCGHVWLCSISVFQVPVINHLGGRVPLL